MLARVKLWNNLWAKYYYGYYIMDEETEAWIAL